jgi:hypothetical protein
VRTYYDLEDYHWDMIKDKGLKKDKKVWVAITTSYKFGPQEAIITGFDIHFEGEIEIEVKLKAEEPYDWDANPKEYDAIPSTVFMYQVHDTKEQTVAFLRTWIRNKIRRFNETIKYYENQLDNLTV